MADRTVTLLEDKSGIKARILLVDDSHANILSLQALLEGLGVEMVVAHSGEDAIVLARNESFAVILLDVRMPGIDGFETAKLIRQSAQSNHTPIIFLTANDVDREQLEKGYALGAVDFLVKPLVPFVLQAKVRSLVQLFQDKERARSEGELLRLLVHGTADYAIFVLDPSGIVSTWNLGAQRLKGYAADEIIGQHFSRFYPAEAIERGWPAHELAVATDEGRFEDEGWRVRKDGTRFWANVVITALRDEKHVLRGFSKVTRDLTSRKIAEEALRQSEERFRLLIESAKDYAIFLLDPHGLVATWNAGAERIKQYHSDEIIGQHFSKFYPQEAIDRGWPEHELKTAAAEGRFEDEGWRVRKDGTLFWANVVITALRDEHGVLQGFSKITRDLTDRKQAEEAARKLAAEQAARQAAEEAEHRIRQSEERRRLALDAGELGAWNIDPAEMLLATDERFRLIFSGSLQPLTYEQAFSLIYPDDRGRIRDAVLAAMNPDNPAPYAEEYRVVHPSGAIRWVFAKGRAHFIETETGRKLHSFDGTVADITERKKMEEELRRVAAEMSDADNRKNEFLAMLAHELRNPLAPIRNALQIVKLSGGDPEAVEPASEMMGRQIDQMVRLVDDLLDVSRITSGKIELRLARVDLASVIQQAIETSRPAIEAAKHELTVSLPWQPVYFNADAVRLAQVFSNLLNNSCKYSEPEGRIWLTGERRGTDILVTVKDTGVGISPEMLPRVFDLFTQVDKSLERAQGGLGIGLALVKTLVEMHGGAVTVRSDGLGKGTEFTVKLPILATEPAPTPKPETAEPTKANSRRILVVDDNRDSAKSLAMLLKLTGHKTQTAHDGLEAVEAAEKFLPEVILLDIGLPKLNGYEVARRIREQPWGAAMTLVALTGWGQDEDRRKSSDAGFNYHIVKPIDHSVLKQLLAELKP